MINQIKNAFPQKEKFIQERAEIEFGVIDEAPKCCKVVGVSDSCTFRASRNSDGSIVFVAIDNGVYRVKDEFERCDFAIFKSPHFCFVEIKDSEKRDADRIGKAMRQLRTTIEKFSEKLVFDGFKLEAIICFRNEPIVPETVWQDATIDFWTKTRIPLFDSKNKDFG